jgi:hypothetical protein
MGDLQVQVRPDMSSWGMKRVGDCGSSSAASLGYPPAGMRPLSIAHCR